MFYTQNASDRRKIYDILSAQGASPFDIFELLATSEQVDIIDLSEEVGGTVKAIIQDINEKSGVDIPRFCLVLTDSIEFDNGMTTTVHPDNNHVPLVVMGHGASSQLRDTKKNKRDNCMGHEFGHVVTNNTAFQVEQQTNPAAWQAKVAFNCAMQEGKGYALFGGDPCSLDELLGHKFETAKMITEYIPELDKFGSDQGAPMPQKSHANINHGIEFFCDLLGAAIGGEQAAISMLRQDSASKATFQHPTTKARVENLRQHMYEPDSCILMLDELRQNGASIA